MAQSPSENLLACWLSVRGYPAGSCVATAVYKCCDTLRDLFALKNIDFDSMTALKIGTRRVLYSAVSSARGDDPLAVSITDSQIPTTKLQGEVVVTLVPSPHR